MEKKQRGQMKTLQCKICGTDVHNCGTHATAVTCYRCVIELYWQPLDNLKKKSIGFPKGWRFMKVFVHENGTVYHKGEEQPELKGTLEPTPIAVKEYVPKKSKAQKAKEKQEALEQLNKLKKDLKSEKRKTYQKKIETEIKKLQKLI
jgi:hypothetical protein